MSEGLVTKHNLLNKDVEEAFFRSKIQQVAVSGTHIVTLTVEGMVFTWGEGNKGQLGHGDLGKASNYI